MSFSFRRTNTAGKVETTEDEGTDRWQFGYSGINFDDEDLEIENAPAWPESSESDNFVSVEQLEIVGFNANKYEQVEDQKEEPHRFAIELVEDMQIVEQEHVAPLQVVTEQVVLEESFPEMTEEDFEDEFEEAIAVVAKPSPATFPKKAVLSGRILPSDPALSFEQNLRRRFGGQVSSALGPGTVVEGKFRFDEPVRIEGSLNGEVRSSSALIVGEEATVEARVNVGSLIVLGEVTGNIVAEDLVELKAGARVIGNISTQRIAIEEGAFFEGEITIR